MQGVWPAAAPPKPYVSPPQHHYRPGTTQTLYLNPVPAPRADQVLVTEAAETPFSVVAPLRRLPCGRTLYKLFSVAPIGHLLPDMFADHVKVP